MRRNGLALAAAALGLSALGVAAWWWVQGWRDDRDYARGAREMAAAAYRPARARLARLAARRPHDADVWFRLGVCEQALGHPEAALRALERVPADSPDGPNAALRRARILTRDFGRLAEAEPLLESALRGPPRVAVDATWALYELFGWEARTEDARRLLRDGLGRAKGTDREDMLRQLWRMEIAVVTPEDVGPVLRAAARHAPDDPRVRLVRAAMAVRGGRLDEAARELDVLTATRPDDPVTWRARLTWAVAAGRPAEAAAALRRLPDGVLSPRELLSLRAWSAARRGDVGSERRALGELSDLDPGDPVPLDRLAALAHDAGDPAAADLRRRKAELDRRRDRYLWLITRPASESGAARCEELARLAESIGRPDDALAWWTQAVARAPGVTDVRDARDRLARLIARRPAPDAGVTPRALADELARAERPESPPASPPSIPRFVDAAESFGLRFTYQAPRSPKLQIPEVTGGGVALLDYDGDGWLDVYFVQGGPSFPPEPGSASRNGDRLFRNRGDGTFQDVSGSAGVADTPGGFGFGVTAGDYDNDGDPDLFVTRWRSYLLLRNRGDGTFEDATERAGLGGDRDWPTSAAFADLDNDGDLDLYVCHYLVWDAENPPVCPSPRVPGRVGSCLPHSFPARPDHLFRNDGGRFVDVTREAGIVDRDGRGLGVVAADLNGDGRTDLYVANDQSANLLFLNRGGLTFDEVGFASGAACAADGLFRAGMGVACADLDGDGFPDLAVTNFYRESTSLYHNLGDGTFTDRTAASGLGAATLYVLGFGVAAFDADCDGRLDLAQANGHVNDERPFVPYAMNAQLLLGGAGGRFKDASATSGPPFRREVVGRGLAAGDLDNDGRVDVVVVPQNDPVLVARNATDGGRSVTFRLEGTASNRDGVGASVAVVAGGRRLRSWRVGGGSYQSASDPRLHFGLGESRRVDRVEVTWPSGRVDRYGDLASGRGYVLREGAPAPRPLAGFDERRHRDGG